MLFRSIAALRAADTLEQAQQRAVHLIAYRPRSVREVRQRLEKTGVDEGTIERVIEQLRKADMLNDEAFSKAWVESRLRATPRGRRMIAWELRRKGVDDAVVKEALEEVDPAAEEEAARRLVRRKLRSVARVDDTVATRRLVGMLARKGYPGGLAFAVVREELQARGRDGVEDDLRDIGPE